MSVTVFKGDGVTVLTLTSDPQSLWPPLCQILGSLCYSPVCCSVSQRLRSLSSSSQTVLGSLHIMVGLLNIGFGVILSCSHTEPWWYIDAICFPYWLAGLFIVFGIVCIFSDKYPSTCLVVLTVTLNLAGVAFAITAVALYSVYLGGINPQWGCDYDYNPYNGYWYDQRTPKTPTLEEKLIREKCWEAQAVLGMLLRSISALMITLSVLELCVVISSAALGIKALSSKEKRADDPELYEPLLEEVTAQPEHCALQLHKP